MALIAEWGFNEGTGTSTADLTSGGAVAVGTAWVTGGHTGGGGGASWHVDKSHFTQNTGTFSLMCWVKMDTISAWGTFIGDGSELWLEIGPNGVVDFYGNADPAPSASTPLTTGVWYHIAVVCDTGVATLYIDGTSVGTGTNAYIDFSVDGLYFAGGEGQDLTGTVDDVRFFDSAITSTEVGTWMNTPVEEAPSTVPSFSLAGEVAWTGEVALSSPVIPVGGIDVVGSIEWAGSVAVSNPGVPVPSIDIAGDVAWVGSVTLSVPILVPSIDIVGSLTWEGAATFSEVSPSKFVTGISGRNFIDQYGDPILIKGDSPWSIFTDLTASDVDDYLDVREGQGFNAILVSLVGSAANGGPSNDGATHDSVKPFVSGDITAPNEAYWSRVDDYVARIVARGISIMMYPIDAWNIDTGCVFNGKTEADCQAYGAFVANRYGGTPGVFWAFGGDYYPVVKTLAGDTMDKQQYACLTGIRSTDNTAPVTLQLGFVDWPTSSISTQNLYWKDKIDWVFVYSYTTTYATQMAGMSAAGTRPAMFAEGAYLDDTGNNGDANTLRRQFGWAITSGSPGSFTGSDSGWKFASGWLADIAESGFTQLQKMRETIESLAWDELVPSETIVTAGRGTRIAAGDQRDPRTNNYVTAAVTADKSLAVVYVPDASTTITIDDSRIGSSPTARWVDPATGASTSTTWDTSYSKGNNAAGDSDWLLVLEAAPVSIVPSIDISGSLTWVGDVTVSSPTVVVPSIDVAGFVAWAGDVALSMPAVPVPHVDIEGALEWAGLVGLSDPDVPVSHIDVVGEVNWTGDVTAHAPTPGLPSIDIPGDVAWAGSVTLTRPSVPVGSFSVVGALAWSGSVVLRDPSTPMRDISIKARLEPSRLTATLERA